MLNNVLDRAIKLAHPVYTEENLCKIKCAFVGNGYPEGLINRSIKNTVNKAYNTTVLPQKPLRHTCLFYISRELALALGKSSVNTYRYSCKVTNVEVAFYTNNNNSQKFV